MNRQVFWDANNVVVNIIVGSLTEAHQQQFLADYSIMYGAVGVIEVDEQTMVWLGGTYTQGEFAPPEPEPQPEAQPELIVETEI